MKHIYKFQPISDYTIDALENHYLYFPTPSQLDDPFDCLFALDLDGDKIDNLPFRSDAHDIGEGVRIVREKIGILSLSKINNHIILWSQYAGGHNGICLKFKTYDHNDKPYFAFEESHFKGNGSTGTFILPIHEVIYDNKVPTPMKLGEAGGFDRFLLTKHKDWSYQAEYRISTDFRTLKGNQKVKYKKEFLEAIIFGMKSSREQMLKIKNIMENHYISQGYEITFYKARQVKGQYAIELQSFSFEDQTI